MRKRGRLGDREAVRHGRKAYQYGGSVVCRRVVEVGGGGEGRQEGRDVSTTKRERGGRQSQSEKRLKKFRDWTGGGDDKDAQLQGQENKAMSD